MTMLLSHWGEIAALLTAFCWTIMGLFFETAGRKVGSLTVNFIRLIFGFIFLTIFTYFTRGYLLPTDASSHSWIWLGLSGIAGFFLGDLFLFQAYLEIGTRISMLILAASPPITAFLGYIFLNERLSWIGLVGMAITISGIALVILARDQGEDKLQISHPIKGIIYALLGAVGQAVGSILSKIGIGDYNPFAATQIRIISSFISFFLLFLYLNKWEDLKKAFRNKKAMIYIALGSIFGPFIGVSLQLISLQYTTAGISATIIAIMPVLIIPFSIIIFKEEVRLKEIIGAVISVVGIGILFLT